MIGSNFLDYGVLGAAILVLLVAVSVLIRVLIFARELIGLVLERIEDNSQAMATLAERIGAHEEGL